MTFIEGKKPMFKHLTLSAIGLTAALSAAQADTLLSVGPHPALGPYASPSFGRMVEICARFGLDCSAPGASHDGSYPHLLSPEALADAGKRHALYAQDWQEFLDTYEDHVELVPAPVLPRPFGLYGYALPRPVPLPRVDLYGYGPRLDIGPRPVLPYVSPFGTRPFGSLPRGPLIPWPSL